MAQVSLRHVHKIFPGGVNAVKDFNLGVESKEFIVIVGPSGCGKSTTLRMIAGLEEVTSGEIYIGDKLVNDVPPKDRNIAMVFQNYALYPHMSVYDNMAFGLRLRGYAKSQIKERVMEAAKILGIHQLLGRKPKELSGGEKQRGAVGRAIVRKPLVFLFDEPLSNLDAKLRVQMRAELNKLHNRLQTTMIYVTHDQVEAMTLGSRIVVMKDGIIQQVADPLTLYSHPVNKFVASFIGTPPMNFIQGRLVEHNGKYFFDEGGFKVRILEHMIEALKNYVGKEIILGIRAEDIYDKFFTTHSTPENTINVLVDIVEPMGSEIYLYLNTGRNILIARIGGITQPPQVNQKIEVVLDMNKVHFFDKDTEKALV
ncbi:MAG: sn-glycerol-3-phosphate ABC transporter ATP-binding protein UgpC [Candidatus Omnitrophica bacterium]|nr:sn-glycerol-3-phosphate ABC transporter ATP-binding protein UgpC [Candidatus Omnitrophota bacterium]